MINRVVLVGRLTKDVEVRRTNSGLSVASFTVACDRRFARSQNNDPNQQTADFINCIAWRQTADFLGQYARKGAMVGVEGRIQTRSYDRDGQRIYVTEVQCDSVQLLESKSQSQARVQTGDMNGGYSGGYQQPAYAQPNNYAQPVNSQPSQPSQDDFGDDDFGLGAGIDIASDDLPF